MPPNSTKNELVLCLYHNSHSSKKKWEDEYCNPFVESIKDLIGSKFKNPIDFRVEVMPFYEEDYTKQTTNVSSPVPEDESNG